MAVQMDVAPSCRRHQNGKLALGSGNRLLGNMFSFVFRKTSAWDYQRRPRRPPTNTVTLHVGTDYCKAENAARITTEWLPTSNRESGAHIQWNHLPTSTGIRSLCSCLGILAPKLFGYVAVTIT
jgi:hypothetical protein